MARLNLPGEKGVINAVTTYILPNPSNRGESVGSISVQLVSNSFTGSVTVKARSLALAATDPTGVTGFTAWYYQTNAGVVGTAALTGSALLTIPAAGMEIALDCTSASAGSLTVYSVGQSGTLAT